MQSMGKPTTIGWMGVGAVAAAVILASGGDARACGGTFCSAPLPGGPLQPVEQEEERILFVVNEDAGTTTAVVDIAYGGDPDAFSWVVPVPEAPVLAEVPPDTLRALSQGTQPIYLPPVQNCQGGGGGRRMWLGGCASGGSNVLASDFERSAGAFVNVETLPQVGPLLPVVVDSTDSGVLIDWLNDNGYLITPAMEPLVEHYVTSGMKFLAMQLAPDGDASSISPISMTCPGPPTIPIRLTAVGAQPEMSIAAFIVADSAYGPANFDTLRIDPTDIQPRLLTGTTNYFPLVSQRVDEAGGQAFVVELNQPTAWIRDRVVASTTDGDSAAYLANVLRDTADGFAGPLRQITRLYTRMSPWEMTLDPVFSPQDLEPFDGTYDASGQTIDGCLTGDPPCGDMYCGPGAECATTAAGSGCVCPAGQVARSTGSGALPSVFCVDPSFDPVASEVSAAPNNPCATVNCGAGACQAVGGFASCRCDSGYAAVPGVTSPFCARVDEVQDPTQLIAAPTVISSLTDNSSSLDWLILFALGLFIAITHMGRRRA